MYHKRTKRSKLTAAFAVALAGGTLLSTCTGRVKDGIIDGSKDFFFTVIGPEDVLDFLGIADPNADSNLR